MTQNSSSQIRNAVVSAVARRRNIRQSEVTDDMEIGLVSPIAEELFFSLKRPIFLNSPRTTVGQLISQLLISQLSEEETNIKSWERF